MKILMVLERDFPPDLRVENEIKSLIKNGHQITLACYTFSNKDSVFNWNGCKVYKKKISTFIYKSSIGALKFPFYFNFWRKHVKNILIKENIDAIHIHDLPLAQIGTEFKRKHNLKFILDLHENWPAYLEVSLHTKTILGRLLSNLKQWDLYEKRMCKEADNIIVVVEEAKTRLTKIDIDKNKITIVSNYLALDDFKNLTITTNTNKNISLFYAGGINKHRGLQYIIQALRLLKKDGLNIELNVYGQGNYLNHLQNLVKELDLKEIVFFHGQVNYDIVLKELLRSNITLIPHIKNNHTDNTIPHKLFQYIYAGKPVLASNCKPIERIVNSINAGKIYQWNNPKDAADKLIWITKNYSTFDPERLRNVITSNFNWESEANKLNSIYI